MFLQRHPELIDKFQRNIAKIKNGQDFYFEQFINIDGLNSYYGMGLRYYLNEKKTAEAQIFGHSILCAKNWLLENPHGVRKHYDMVMIALASKSNQRIFKCPVLCRPVIICGYF